MKKNMQDKLLHYLNESPTVFFILKKENKSWELEYVTSNVINLYGYSAKDFLSKKVKHEDFIFQEDLHTFRTESRQVSKVIKDEYIYKPYRIVKNNQIIWVNHILKIIHDENGRISHYYGYLNDITESQKIKKELEEHLNIINNNVLISITNKDGFIIDVSDAYCKLTQYSKKELIGKKHNIFRHSSIENSFFKELWEIILKGNIWKGEHLNIKKDGTEFWVENSITPNFDEYKNIIGFTSVYNDITDKKKISEISITDFLTELYNRRHFNTIFDLEFKRAKRDNKNFVLLILDIDFFKQYNDTYGHDGGDCVLKQISDVLKSTLKRSNDYIFRLGGEEFGIITSNIQYIGVVKLCNKLLDAVVNLKIKHRSSSINDFVTISIGAKIVKTSNDINDKTIFKSADNALYEAKEQGRNRAVIKE
jgi:diguanylate cyclase (GGDEF)-like protein/PAS domain S-box-containing protein